MTTIELISSHPDIYDGLVDVYGIDLIYHNNTESLWTALDEAYKKAEGELEAQLAMIMGFIEALYKING